MRKRVSFTFFKAVFDHLLFQFEPHRQTYRGLRLYGVDGFQVHLPRTKDIVENGCYTGRSTSKYSESYTPRMYLSHCYDLLSGVTKEVSQSCENQEIKLAQETIPQLEQKSLCIYDRLYMSEKLIKAHKQAKNYFLFRCKSSSTFKQAENFWKSKKKIRIITLCGVKITLIKIKNPKAKKSKDRVRVLATNLPKSWHDFKTMDSLYRLRWEVETSFKDLADTMKLEQWHSKLTNGILQELYASLWLMNFTKIQILQNSPKKLLNIRNWNYEKPNFKLILNHIVSLLPKIFKRIRGLFKELKILINLSTEKRKHYSRAYPRELKTPASPYKYNNTKWVWDLK